MKNAANVNKDSQLSLSTSDDQYLTFLLNDEEYGLNILNIQEIKGWSEATPMPNTPEHILGVINLRGTVVPIVDLRKCFNLSSESFGPTTVVIMVKAISENKDRIIGIVVDAVSEVYNIRRSNIEPPPNMGTIVSTEYIDGLATVENKMVIILDINHLINYKILDLKSDNDELKNEF